MAFTPLLSMLRSWQRDADEEELAALPETLIARTAPLLPELGARFANRDTAQAIPPEYAYTMLVNGLVDLFVFVSRRHPLILSLDDLQWADEATLLVLYRLAQLDAATDDSEQAFPLFLVVSYRPEDTSENQPLHATLRYLGRERLIRALHLARFNQEEVSEYLHLHQAAPPLSSEKLYQSTRGNALFLVEAVRTLLEEQEPFSHLSQQDTVVNALLHLQQIRDVVLARVARLPQEARALLEVASVLGHPFPLALLRPEPGNEDYETFDLLVNRHFFVEVVPSADCAISLSFSHEMVGHIVYTTCSTVRTRQLHHFIAERLVNYYAANREPYAAEIAFH